MFGHRVLIIMKPGEVPVRRVLHDVIRFLLWLFVTQHLNAANVLISQAHGENAC